jgi:dihydroorotate dehydrogenase (fumarate)
VSVDLATTYLGLELANPVVASASPQTDDVDVVRALADAGAAAVVMPSLFEEEITHDEIQLNRALEAGMEHFAEALDYFPDVGEIEHLDDRYLRRLEALKAAVDIPVLASLNAVSPGAWVDHASRLAAAGADAIELNLYKVAADPTRSATDVEAELISVVAAVRASAGVPVAVKLSPFFSSLAHFAADVVGAGADGLVLFNRFYQPDIDLEEMSVVPTLQLSTPWELRLPLRWLAILRPLLGEVSLGATTGIASGTDVVKALAVGADVAMLTSAVLRHGPGHVAVVLDELTAWLEDHEYESARQLRGSMSHATTDDPSAYERANYRRVLHSWGAPHELTPSSPSP